MESNHQNLQFKTNINCGGCVAKVTPFLKGTEGVTHWEVATADKDKVLTIAAEGVSEEEIIAVVQKAGFKIEPLNS